MARRFSRSWSCAGFQNTVRYRSRFVAEGGAKPVNRYGRSRFRRGVGLIIFAWTIFGLILPPPSRALSGSRPLELPAGLQHALDSLRNGKYQQTIESSQSLREEFPGHPLPFLIAAESNWGLIFCQTGHINSREIWNAAEEKSSPFDGEFSYAVESALSASEAMRENPETAALGAFYQGLAHGVRARLYTLRAERLSSGQEGKQMRESLLEAAALDSELQADSDAGLGAYNYYADVLSPLIKLFRFFLLIPGGDRERGIAQLESAAQNAVLVAPEAQYELAKIYGVRENRPADSLLLFRGLIDQYPENAIFALSGAIQAARVGNRELAVRLARRAVQASLKMDDVCRVRLEAASQQAVDRLTSDDSY